MTVYQFRDNNGEIVLTPCCSSPLWTDLYFVTALCFACCKAHSPEDLGAVEHRSGDFATDAF